MEQEQNQVKTETKTIGIVSAAVVITVLIVGGGMYWWQQMAIQSLKDNSDRTIEAFRQENAELKNQTPPTLAPKVIEKIVEVTTAPTQPTQALQLVAQTSVTLPQVFFQARSSFLQKDIDDIDTKVVKPLVAYYEKQGQKVVSVTIEKSTAAGYDIAVDALIARDKTSADPVYHGFLYKKEGGTYPLWKPEEAPQGYQG